MPSLGLWGAVEGLCWCYQRKETGFHFRKVAVVAGRRQVKGPEWQQAVGPRADLLPSMGLSAPTLPFPADLGTPIPAKYPDQCGLRCQLSHQDLRAHLWPEAKLEVRGQRCPWAQAGEREELSRGCYPD